MSKADVHHLIDVFGWDILPPDSGLVRMDWNNVRGVFFHYIDGRQDRDWLDTRTEEITTLRSIDADTTRREFSTFPYSLALGLQTGLLYDGRGLDWKDGATSPDWSGRSISCLLIGGGSPLSPPITDKAKLKAKRLAGAVGGFVLPHRAAYNTSCPGDEFTHWLAAGMPLDVQEEQDMPARLPDDVLGMYRGAVIVINGTTKKAHHIKTPADVDWVKGAYWAAVQSSPTHPSLRDERTNPDIARLIDSGFVQLED